jgi:hypothetical protein
MANAPNAILAISSTDRYITTKNGRADQPIQDVLVAQYINSGPPPNDFSITAPGALMNGYIDKIIVSQIQLQYNLPTVVPERNDLMLVSVETGNATSVFTTYGFNIPYGFFNPDELSAMLQVFLNQAVYGYGEDGHFTVQYNQGFTTLIAPAGFEVLLEDGSKRFFFPDPTTRNLDDPDKQRVLKTYKLFGFTLQNAEPEFPAQNSWSTPDFLYTPYIDIYSDALTNYQKLKDTDTATSRRKGLVSRVYLSGVGTPVTTTGGYTNVTTGSSLGSSPFVLTYDLNTPKVINWTPDTAVNSIDFQVRDCYGDFLFSSLPRGNLVEGYLGEAFNTEFQMTLLCIEGER